MLISNPGFLTVLLMIFVFVISCILIARKKTTVKYLLILLRVLSLLTVIFLIFEPTLLFYENKTKPKVAVLVDTSRSMGFSGRIGAVKKFFNKNLPLIQKYFVTDFYQFSKNASSVKDNEIKGLEANGNATDITQTLDAVCNNKNYDAVVLLSDGINNSDKNIKNVYGLIKVPIIGLYPNEPDAPRDLALIDIKTAGFVFKNVPTQITVGFYSNGFLGREVKIYLKKDKEILASKRKTIDSSYQEASFDFTSTKIGLETYSIEIEPLPEETVLSNNHKEFNIETIREKIRVLYICGQPSSEYYYLRHFIKSNPSLELVSFVILRNPEDVAVVPDEQLSLIPFPEREIFTKDLYDFDVFILENFNYSRFYIPTEYMTNITRFVKEKSGGFLMIGGTNSFGRGNYKNTPIEEVIPVIMDNPSEPFEEGPFKVKLDNYTHPIVNISDDQTSIEKIWSALPELDGSQRLRAKPGATVLATNPFLKIDGQSAVTMAVQEIGKGRSMAIGTDTTWRWMLGKAQEGKSGSEYTKFWENVIYWLSGSEQTKEFRISVEQRRYIPGEEIKFKLIVLSEKLRKAVPTVTLTDPLSRLTQLENLTKVPEGWVGRFTPNTTGKYEIKAQIKTTGVLKGSMVSQDTRSVIVMPDANTEDYDLQVNDKLMKEIALNTKGIAVSLDDFSINDMNQAVGKNAHPVIKKQLSLALFPGFYFVIFLLLAVEWIIRRLKGLL
ncbi:MAG: hypothetical protein A3J83_01920 [Elusimicrobia bacterium RIFOXYA2_FULL_40_6]|nr:MAG: hypothetical protein A3J83_01920 [Elusimicrobia bacterium RIFOXYA2_FULL_40_6]